jgi:hypothetical protein
MTTEEKFPGHETGLSWTPTFLRRIYKGREEWKDRRTFPWIGLTECSTVESYTGSLSSYNGSESDSAPTNSSTQWHLVKRLQEVKIQCTYLHVEKGGSLWVLPKQVSPPVSECCEILLIDPDTVVRLCVPNHASSVRKRRTPSDLPTNHAASTNSEADDGVKSSSTSVRRLPQRWYQHTSSRTFHHRSLVGNWVRYQRSIKIKEIVLSRWSTKTQRYTNFRHFSGA